MKWKNLENKLGYVFHNRQLLEQALTHSSWVNEYDKGQEHNERFEFLGDAILEFCVSKVLFTRFADVREGVLTQLRSQLVSEACLAQRAQELGLGALLRLGKGEEKQGGRQRAAILCDAFEALLAAIYLDGGIGACEQAVEVIFRNHWPTSAIQARPKDAKTRLQEKMQQVYHCLPEYVHLPSKGPEHAKRFTVTLHLPNGPDFSAVGSSCKRAEQNVARQVLSFLEQQE